MSLPGEDRKKYTIQELEQADAYIRAVIRAVAGGQGGEISSMFAIRTSPPPKKVIVHLERMAYWWHSANNRKKSLMAV
jgi:hypothetical protein